MNGDGMRSATVLLLAFGLLVSCQSRPLSDVGTTTPTETEPALVRTPAPPSVGQGDTLVEEIVATPQPAVVTAEASATVTQALQQYVPPLPTVKPTETPYSAAGGLEAEVWEAIQVYFPSHQWSTALRVSGCETGGTYNPGAIGAHGEEGIFQVRAIYHGAVPRDIAGQVQQAAGIWSAYGWQPWSCA